MCLKMCHITYYVKRHPGPVTPPQENSTDAIVTFKLRTNYTPLRALPDRGRTSTVTLANKVEKISKIMEENVKECPTAATSVTQRVTLTAGKMLPNNNDVAT